MTLNPVASGFLVAFYIIGVLFFVGAMAAIALALTKLNEKLETLTAQVEPLLHRADSILTVTDEKVRSLGDSAETILTRGEETAEALQTKVETASDAVQKTVHAPIIGLNSLVSGVTEGWATFTRLQSRTNRAATDFRAVNTVAAPQTAPAVIAETETASQQAPVASLAGKAD